MTKACIFDLDGTLMYTLESMALAANRMLKDLSLPPLPVENFRYYCGEGADMLVRRVLAEAGDPQLAMFEKASALYRRYFGENPMYKAVPYPDIPQLLSVLKEKGLLLAVCSNKPHEATVSMMQNTFPGIFDLVVGQSGEHKRKPSPETPLYIARTFGVSPEDCMYVGDSGTDMQTGKAAGMFTVGVLWGYRDLPELEENGADEAVFAPLELLPLAGV